jgi:hemoglobin
MNTQMKITTLLVALFILMAAGQVMAGNSKATNDQILGLKSMCSETADAQAERQGRDSLYIRLGGYDKILTFTTEVVRLHNQNNTIKSMFKNVDPKMLAKHVADFVAAGTGGKAEYTGRSMISSHAQLSLTDADFLSAGGDIVTAMNSVGYGQNEIDEMLCILMSLKDQVVFK